MECLAMGRGRRPANELIHQAGWLLEGILVEEERERDVVGAAENE